MKKLLALTVLIILLTACSPPEETTKVEQSVSGWTLRYESVEIEGMPCLVFNGYRRMAVTCDWSRYRGE